jgi:CRISPR-associated protein Cas1
MKDGKFLETCVRDIQSLLAPEDEVTECGPEAFEDVVMLWDYNGRNVSGGGPTKNDCHRRHRLPCRPARAPHPPAHGNVTRRVRRQHHSPRPRACVGPSHRHDQNRPRHHGLLRRQRKGLDFAVHGHDWIPVDYEGLHLMLRPTPKPLARNNEQAGATQPNAAATATPSSVSPSETADRGPAFVLRDLSLNRGQLWIYWAMVHLPWRLQPDQPRAFGNDSALTWTVTSPMGPAPRVRGRPPRCTSRTVSKNLGQAFRLRPHLIWDCCGSPDPV